mgnify:CR=1 FL=1
MRDRDWFERFARESEAAARERRRLASLPANQRDQEMSEAFARHLHDQRPEQGNPWTDSDADALIGKSHALQASRERIRQEKASGDIPPITAPGPSRESIDPDNPHT